MLLGVALLVFEWFVFLVCCLGCLVVCGLGFQVCCLLFELVIGGFV